MGMSIMGKIVMGFIILVLALMGVLIKYLKCYFLIAGYNTMSAERKKNVDVERLSNHLGNFLIITSAVILAGVVLESLKVQFALQLSLFSILFIIPIMIIGAQRFDRNNYTSDGKMKTQLKILIVMILLIPVIMVTMIGYKRVEPRVIVNDDYIEIKGTYGTRIDIEEITDVTLRASIPDIKRKINGFNAGRIMKGNFELDELGRGKIYIYKGDGPYIYIYMGEEFIIFNYKDSIKTEKLYEKVLSAWDR